MTGTVLVTRPAAGAGPLVRALRERGYIVRAVATVATVAPTAAQRIGLDAAIGDRAAFDWVVVTSPEGARRVVARLAVLPAPPSGHADPRRWAAVGPGTAAVLAAAGITPAAMPERAAGAAICDAIARIDDLAGRRVLLARGDIAGADLPTGLRRAGAHVIEVVAYRTIEGPARSSRRLRDALDDPALSVITFASGSAVRGLVALLDGPRLERARALPSVTIGAATTVVAASFGFSVAAEAEGATPAALASAVDRTFGRPQAPVSAGPRSSPSHLEHAP